MRGRLVEATFHRRKTMLPGSVPTGLSEEFFLDSTEQVQWRAFLHRGKLRVREEDLRTVVWAVGILFCRLLWQRKKRDFFNRCGDEEDPGGPDSLCRLALNPALFRIHLSVTPFRWAEPTCRWRRL